MALGQPALSLLDVGPVSTARHAEFAYLRQTVRTNAAAVVPEGSVKPTSIYTINKVPNTLAVVPLLSKHLSLSLLAAHGSEATRALLQRIILDAGAAGEAAEGPDGRGDDTRTDGPDRSVDAGGEAAMAYPEPMTTPADDDQDDTPTTVRVTRRAPAPPLGLEPRTCG